jgi:YD repeat-containing protein
MAINPRAAYALLFVSACVLVLFGNQSLAAEDVIYEYDALGRLSTATYGNGEKISYVYDAAGNRTQLVQAGPPPPTGSLSANPAVVGAGGTSTLTWSSDKATSASIDNGVGAVTPVSGGSRQVTPPTTTTYTLTLTGLGGSITKQATVVVDTVAPSTPTITSWAVRADKTVKLNWTASTDSGGGSGVAGYEIFKGCPLGSIIATTTSLTYTTPPQNDSTTCNYSVRSYDNVSIRSSFSNEVTVTTPDTTAPSVPSALTATVAGDTQVNLSWTGSSDTGGSGLAGYKIYRGGTQIGTSASTSFSDPTVSTFNIYTYTVAAYDNSGNTSAQSSSAGASMFYPITDGSGNILSAASSLYTLNAGCQTNPVICRWLVNQAYGSRLNVVTVITGVNGTPPACASGTTQQILAGYQRSGCVLRAAPSVYGH